MCVCGVCSLVLTWAAAVMGKVSITGWSNKADELKIPSSVPIWIEIVSVPGRVTLAVKSLKGRGRGRWKKGEGGSTSSTHNRCNQRKQPSK